MAAQDNFDNRLKKTMRQLRIVSVLGFIASLLLVVLLVNPDISFGSIETEESITEIDNDLIENGIHVRTGFIAADGYETVVQNCTSCHSSKLVIQNRMNADRWNATIKWMQKTQNLWDLGENQEVIVNYLVTNYPPIDKGRRENLKDLDWYVLKE